MPDSSDVVNPLRQNPKGSPMLSFRRIMFPPVGSTVAAGEKALLPNAMKM